MINWLSCDTERIETYPPLVSNIALLIRLNLRIYSLPSVPAVIPTIRATILCTTIIGHTSLLIHLLLPVSTYVFCQSVFANERNRLASY
jgi:hypothetical protein